MRTRRAPHRERPGAGAGETVFQREEESRERADVIRVKVGDREVGDLPPREAEPGQRLQRSGTAVEEDARACRGFRVSGRDPVGGGRPVRFRDDGPAPDDDEFIRRRAVRRVSRGFRLVHATCVAELNSTPTIDETPASCIVTP